MSDTDPSTPPEYLRGRDVDERYGVCPATRRRWAELGLIPPPVRIGKTLFWHRATLLAWEAARREATP